MAVARCQVSIPHDNGLPRDAINNVWYFRTPLGVTLAHSVLIGLRLTDFYNGIFGYYSKLLNPAGARLRVYDMADAPPRAPKGDLALLITTPPASTALPSEVALCLTFQGLKVSGLPQARRRGRLYLGPFGTSANDGTNGVPNDNMVPQILTQATNLKNANNDADNIQWVVRSQVAQSVVDVDNGWVDNAFDTQRRRGPGPTARSLF